MVTVCRIREKRYICSQDSQNRLTATTDGQVGAILVSPSPVNEWLTVTLYNAQGQVLYSQEGQP